MKKLSIGWKVTWGVVVCALAIGWLPLFIDEAIVRFTGDPNYKGAGFAMAWGLTITTFCTIISILVLLGAGIYQIARLSVGKE